jgi:hypothetical protein
MIQQEVQKIKHQYKIQKNNPLKIRRFKMATVDMDAAGSFEIYPAGTYRCEVTGWEFGESSIKKTKQVRIKTTMVMDKKPYTEFIPITDASAWKIGNFIKACGIKLGGKLDTDSALFQQVLNALVGRTVFITLVHDLEYNNNKSTGYARDDEQEEEEFLPVDDAPEFAK